METTQKIGRDDLDNLANFCERARFDEYRRSSHSGIYFELCRKKLGNINSLLGYFLMRERTSSKKPLSRASQVNASSINFLQDTLQTLFGLLASTMISAEPNSDP